jgi:hypothetical protein
MAEANRALISLTFLTRIINARPTPQVGGTARRDAQTNCKRFFSSNLVVTNARCAAAGLRDVQQTHW